ncbi:serine hydrolase domain-containing protein [Coralloluteibacterium stylophorae]|uniref:Beta-lactamase family protein n=1 Tax=Coralloluteibacterium stylophorae TaxID=1776034 RepID=A0A8J7VRZ1_9GAMM|nr:serine hydrolase domain-containing protein [Coralloluteibacterium stylophorae]MBS7457352.1 beta-lactamase family protein [Coralloluteibacterium stylophorae]
MRHRPVLNALFAASLAAFAATPHAARAEVAASPAAVPMPDGFAPEKLARIDAVMQRYVDDGEVAGIVALVLKDGEPVYQGTFGWADREAGRRMREDTIFRIASQTKALTSVAVLMLMEDGRLALDDPAGRYIASFRDTRVAVRGEDGSTRTVPAERPITIRDLLTHTAGISYGREETIAAQYEAKGLGPAAGNGWYTADKREGTCDTMERLGTLPFVAQPGADFVYGYNTDVLGCIVERASGMPLDRFVRERIAAPLGMDDTQFFLPQAQRARLATLYGSGGDGRYVRAPEGASGQGHYVDGPRMNFSGGAGLLSTARDYARFLEMIRRGGELDGVRLLAPRTVALMRTNQVGDRYSEDGLGFGLGFQTVERYGANGMETPGAYGWSGAYGSYYRVDPALGLVTVMMIQLMPNRTNVRDTFANMVYAAME